MYDKDSHISSLLEVEDFARYLYCEKKFNFHPDDDFADYVSLEPSEPSISSEDAALYNRLVEECFAVCDSEQVDIYEVMGKFHPLMQS